MLTLGFRLCMYHLVSTFSIRNFGFVRRQHLYECAGGQLGNIQ